MLVKSKPYFMPLRDPQGKQFPLLLVTRPMLLSLLMGLLGQSHHPLPLRLRDPPAFEWELARLTLLLGDQVPMLLMVNQLMDPSEFLPNLLTEFQ